MDDKELMELAATAAKMDGRMRYCDAWSGMALYTLQDGYFGPTWNPLKDDGDALRLAHKLGLLSDVPVWPRTLEETRRAIVKAAAEIGKDIVMSNVKSTTLQTVNILLDCLIIWEMVLCYCICKQLAKEVAPWSRISFLRRW